MKYLILLILLMEVSCVNAQDDLFSNSSFSKDALRVDGYDVTMKRIPTGGQAEVEGNPMLNQSFENGIVKFRTGEEYKGVKLNFSLLKNQLYFRKDSVDLQFINPVDFFAIPAENDVKKLLSFKSGYPGINSNTEKSYYQVLSDGANVQLLKYIYKNIQEVYHYGAPLEKRYSSLKETFYVFDMITKKISQTEANLNSLKKSLPAYATYIDNYVSQNKINLKHEDKLIGLFEYINAQP